MISTSRCRVAFSLILVALVFTAPIRAQEKGVAKGAIPSPQPVVATQTGPGEITVTWTAVPNAIGYSVGRSVFPNGFQRLCPQCPISTTYVDRSVTAGVRHMYRVVALFPGGRASRAAVSGQITPPENGVGSGADSGTGQQAAEEVAPAPDHRISNPQITKPVTRATALERIVDAGVPPDMENLATPPADSISSCSGAATPAQDSTRRVLSRPVPGVLRSDPEPKAEDPSTDRLPASAAYEEGKCRNPGMVGYPKLWDSVASQSGLSHEEQVAAWKEIGILALAFKHVLQRQPTAEEIKNLIPKLRSGNRGWQQVWRDLAQSPEREQRFGYWAPAPLATAAEAQRAFGLSFKPATEQCFGGLGPACAGTVPDSRVEPRWFGFFKLPGGTQMGYVSLGVAVGSILHDNACLRDRGGLNCNGLGAGDLIKTGLWPGSLEWNKAAWNLIDGRTWREVFGPYPTSTDLRLREWYDDIRLVRNRPAMMAEAISMIAFPGLTVIYRGGETRQSRALKAPRGTSLDDTDEAFCASGRSGERQLAPLKASWAFCK